jgi:ESCRT-II complex subunit VPS36
VDTRKPSTRSFALPLSTISKTEYYAGLFKSSPKVTIHLTPTPTINISASFADPDLESWECPVCSYRNPPGLSPAAARICALCGVPRNSIPPTPSKSIAARSLAPSLPRNLSSSLPNSSATSFSDRSSRASESEDGQSVACSACTFLNDPSLLACEICETPLPRRRPSVGHYDSPIPPPAGRLGKSAPPTRAPSPDVDEDGQDQRATNWMIKLSFRKGGDKSFYAVFRRSLMAKAWEVCVSNSQ